MPKRGSWLSWLSSQAPQRQSEILASLDEAEAEMLMTCWDFTARPEQLEPEGDHQQWLICAGRGFGKTRAGSEWVARLARETPGIRIALVARSAADARMVMVSGESGILSVCSEDERPEYQPSKRQLTWPNGSMAFTYSADEPGQLRGPQHHAAWCDELAAWGGGWDAFDQQLAAADAKDKVKAEELRALQRLAPHVFGATESATTMGGGASSKKRKKIGPGVSNGSGPGKRYKDVPTARLPVRGYKHSARGRPQNS